MPDGSRTQRGCITCRIRKKKCDEQRPICQGCQSRQLACYGYHEPAPEWYTSKGNWKEVRDSDEAKNLRTLAETRYRIRRKVGFTDYRNSSTDVRTSGQCVEDVEYLRPEVQLQPRSAASWAGTSPSSSVVLGGANIWQLRPDSIWWDSKVQSLVPDPDDVSNEKTRLLMLFLDVIHPISHTFYKLDLNKDRSWMLNRLISSKALYDSALSISACFDCSLTQPPSINDIGICPQVRSLQSRAVRELQIEIDNFVAMESEPLENFVWTAVQLLDVVTNLETLEIFSMLQGCWEMHHRAARKILNHVEFYVSKKLCRKTASKTSLVEAVLSTWPRDDERRRSLEFCLTNFVWVDVLAISTFGALSYDACALDYLGLLQSELIKPQNIMGCEGWIMAKIVEIARLEQRKVTSQNRMCMSGTATGLVSCDKQIAEDLKSGIHRLERTHHRSDTNPMEEDIRLISTLWAYGAQILRQTVTSDLEPAQASPDQTYVNACLEKLEELPTRLVMRASWPYTIAGCMSTSESQHERFRRVLGRTMQEAQPPGIAWKGLIVMEECWKLRRVEGNGRIGWREAMEKLGARVLLT